MPSLTVPSPQSASGSFPSSPRAPHRPLSTHGMPKEPRMTSPERPHRFSATGFSPMSFISTPPTQHPRSPGPLSPPMSAKSFGTFIDSEPSTPAYSPRMDHDWDGSTLVLLRPMSSCSEPSSPVEPAWEMVKPIKAVAKAPLVQLSNKHASPFHMKEISTNTSLSSHPIHPTHPSPASVRPKKQIMVNISDKENESPHQDLENSQETGREEHIATGGAAPLGKLASRMKSMLKRRNTEKRRLRKERGYYEVDHVEDAHWTEM